MIGHLGPIGGLRELSLAVEIQRVGRFLCKTPEPGSAGELVIQGNQPGASAPPQSGEIFSQREPRKRGWELGAENRLKTSPKEQKNHFLVVGLFNLDFLFWDLARGLIHISRTDWCVCVEPRRPTSGEGN